MENIEIQYLKYPQMEPIVFEDRLQTLIKYFDVFSSTITQSFYVIDIQQEQFCYIKPDDLFFVVFLWKRHKEMDMVSIQNCLSKRFIFMDFNAKCCFKISK